MLRTTVLANVSYGLDLRGASADRRRKKSLAKLVRVGLSEPATRQARRIPEEVVFLEGGRLLEQTPAAEFFTQPQTLAARDFIREETG